MPTIAEVIEQQGDAIVDRWYEEASRMPSARDLSRKEVVNTLPEYLRLLAEVSRRRDPRAQQKARDRVVETHISLRHRQGYSLGDLASEYAVLGRCFAQFWSRDGAEPPGQDVQVIFTVINDTVGAAVEWFTGGVIDEEQIDKRYLRRLDGIAHRALRDDGTFVPAGRRLDDVAGLFAEALRADAGALLLPVAGDGGGALALAASVGLDRRGPAPRYVVEPGTGAFSERVTTREESAYLPDIAAEPACDEARALVAAGLRSLLGMRIWVEGTVLGVALVGTDRVDRFDPRRRRRLETLVERLALVFEGGRLHTHLRDKMAQLEREKELRERFVSVLAHDLRGPLTTVRVSAELLLRTPEALDTRRELAANIALGVDRTDRMIRDLLDVSRLRAGQPLPLRLDKTDLTSVARSVAEELRVLHGDRFVVRGDARVLGMWSADELRRAIWNLATNAVKYGAPDAPVELTVLARPDGASVAVHNEGAPIPPEEQDGLFTAFTRAPSARTTGPGGWGLGLTLVQGAAEAHGGRVELSSLPERGTTFTITLPADARPFQAGAVPPATLPPTAGP